MEKININNFSQEYPYNHDIDLIKEMNISDDEYFMLLNKYKRMFSSYLNLKIELKALDKSVKESPLEYKKVEKKNMDFYQITDCLDLDFLYVRNNFYIENLNSDEISYLKDCKDDDYEFIKNTFAKVIDKYCNSPEKNIIYYGPDGNNYACESNTVVIGFRYDIQTDEEVISEKTYSQTESANMLCNFLSMTLDDKLNNPIRVIRYDDYSIYDVYKENKKNNKNHNFM